MDHVYIECKSMEHGDLQGLERLFTSPVMVDEAQGIFKLENSSIIVDEAIGNEDPFRLPFEEVVLFLHTVDVEKDFADEDEGQTVY